MAVHETLELSEFKNIQKTEMKNQQKPKKQNQSEKLRRYARMFAELLIEELIRQKENKINLGKTNKEMDLT